MLKELGSEGVLSLAVQYNPSVIQSTHATKPYPALQRQVLLLFLFYDKKLGVSDGSVS